MEQDIDFETLSWNAKRYSDVYVYTMARTMVYSCVFFNEAYIDLISVLLRSYKLFGNPPADVDYLVICNTNFGRKVQEMFDRLHISGVTWCMDLKTKFEAGFSRLKVFSYPNIGLYNKILYLDCSILVTNPINNILDLELENKLYVLQEGNTNHPFWGSQFFDKNPNCSAFTTGVLLFNNNSIIKGLFLHILSHINGYIASGAPIPKCLDQPFIVYHAVKNDLYNNRNLIDIVANNPVDFNNETISRFPGEPDRYERPLAKMLHFMNDVMFNIDGNKDRNPLLGNKKFTWGTSIVTFLEDGNMDAFGPGEYSFINEHLVKCNFGGRRHLLKVSEDYSRFVSVRKGDLEVVSGYKYEGKSIPKIVMQTAKSKPEKYVIDAINQKCPGWEYVHFVDTEIIQYFTDNPIQGFPDIVERFNSFSKGQHKADLFRYYFLYLNGGIFLDSDAIFEMNIDKIIKSYDGVFVKSFMPNTHLFNGFIATHPRNPIIYDALRHAYHTKDMILQKHYHYLCEELWRIFHRHSLPNMKIYQEHNKSHEGYGGSVILDDNGNKVVSHYWQSKKIPFIESSYKCHNSLTREMTQCFDNLNKKINISCDVLVNKTYYWSVGPCTITFLLDGRMTAFGEGKYYFTDEHTVIASFGGHNHCIKFSHDYTTYISVRQNDFDVIEGRVIKPSIPKTVLQLSRTEPAQYIVDMINHYAPDYKYIHFCNDAQIDFLKSNPSDVFPNIVKVYNSFEKGAHRADLFRYFYLYLKGGAYLDYDAMIYTNIDNIVLDYDSVFVRTFPTNEFGGDLIENCWLFVKPGDQVIYQALTNLYNVNPDVLRRDYAWVCRNLLEVYNRTKPTKCRLLQCSDFFATSTSNPNEECGKVFDESNTLLMVHYPITKTVPKPKEDVRNNHNKTD